LNIFVAWRIADLRKKFDREPTEMEIRADLKDWQEKRIFLNHHTENIIYYLRHDFLPIYRRENRINRARKAAKGSWTKAGRQTRKNNRENFPKIIDRHLSASKFDPSTGKSAPSSQ